MLLGVCRESRKGDTVRGNTLSEEREETGLLSHKPLTSVFLPSLSAEPDRVRSCCTLGLRKLPESPGPGTTRPLSGVRNGHSRRKGSPRATFQGLPASPSGSARLGTASARVQNVCSGSSNKSTKICACQCSLGRFYPFGHVRYSQ